MKSLELEKIGSLKLISKPLPEAGPDESLLRVTHCAVCRTDAKMWKMGQRDLVLPRILGHEICGYTETGGKRYVVWPGKSCGNCKQCKTGFENLCDSMEITGFHRNGGFAEFISVPKSGLIPIPDDLDGAIACLAEPLACTINAIEQAEVIPEDDVLIYGAGSVGLLMALSVKAKGANPFLVEIDTEKLIRSRIFQNLIGIKASLNFRRSDFDTVINAASAYDIFENGMYKLRKGGSFCLFSGFTGGNTVSVNLINEIHYRQLKITGAYGCTRTHMEKAVKILLNYKNELTFLIENTIKIEQVPFVMPKVLSGKFFKFVVKL